MNGAMAQQVNQCSVDLEYVIKKDNKNTLFVDTTSMNFYFRNPHIEKDFNLKFDYTTILNNPDFIEHYCKDSICTITEVINKLNEQRKGQIIIEFEDGYFCFYSSLSQGMALTAYSGHESYNILHIDKDVMCKQLIDSNARIAHFLWGKLRFYFILT